MWVKHTSVAREKHVCETYRERNMFVKHMHAETPTTMKPANHVKHMQHMESLDCAKTHGLSIATHVKHTDSETPTKMMPATHFTHVKHMESEASHVCAARIHGESMCFT